MTNGESFSRIRRWIDEINKYCDDTIGKVLVGNKDDNESSDGHATQKIVSTEDAQQYARQMNLTFFETSAKDNKNVDEAFYAVARLALQARLEARRKTQATNSNDMTNGGTSSQAIRLKSSGKSRKKDKKNMEGCCK